MFCWSCGSIVNAANFCTACGAALANIKPLEQKKATKAKSLLTLLAGISVIAAALILYFVLWHTSSGELDGRIMSVFRVEGDLVSLTRTGAAWADAREGTRLHAGYALMTGRGSFCYITLDAASIVKLDQSSGISIVQLTDSLLRVNIDSGQVMINLQTQTPEHELEAIIGNTVISVRGTLFIAGVYTGGEAIITVLDGSVYVNGVPLHAGYTMRVFDGQQMIYTIEPIDLGEADEFFQVAVLDNLDRLMASAFLDDFNLDEVAELIRLVEEDGADGVDLAEVLGDEDEEYDEETQYEEIEPIVVGDIIRFGDYDWRVLDMQDNKSLVISERILFHRAFHDSLPSLFTLTWDMSDIRNYLNSAFYGRFNPVYQTRIVTTYVVNNENPWSGASGGSDTTDRIFLLSLNEVVHYFGDSGQLNDRSFAAYAHMISDQYNVVRKTSSEESYSFFLANWWLRTAGGGAWVVYVEHNGTIHVYGTPGWPGHGGAWHSAEGIGVRPAMWISLDTTQEDVHDDYQTAAISPQLRAAASAFADVLQRYINNHGISTVDSNIGVNGALLVDLDSSGVPVLIVQYAKYNEWRMLAHNIVAYVFVDGRASAQLRGTSTGGTGSDVFSIAIDSEGINYLVRSYAGMGASFSYYHIVVNGEMAVYLSLGTFAEWGIDWSREYFYVNGVRVNEQAHSSALHQLNIIGYSWNLESADVVLVKLFSIR